MALGAALAETFTTFATYIDESVSEIPDANGRAF